MMLEAADVFGRHVVATLSDGESSALTTSHDLRLLLSETCHALDMQTLRTHEFFFGRDGASIVALSDGGYCALHTWSARRRAVVDVFSCGRVDPSLLIPEIQKALGCGQAAVETATQRVMTPARGTYPGFPEYLLDSPPTGVFPSPRFRRGVGREYLVEPEALAWQDFFSSDAYQPPQNRPILLLHPCTWAKPYDMSRFVATLRDTTDRHPAVHRVIISNVGLVPFEYQMNPFFCSYDYASVGCALTRAESDQIRSQYQMITQERILRFLSAHREHYRAVVYLGHPIKNSLADIVARCAADLGLPGFLAPDKGLYLAIQRDLARPRDRDSLLFCPPAMAQLSDRLHALERKLGCSHENA